MNTQSYQIVSDLESKTTDYTPRGGCADFVYSHDREVIAEGASETGKTLAACWKIHLLAIKYPGLNGAIVRNTYKSMPGSVLQTFGRVIDGAPVVVYGGERPEKYIYNNKSVIWVGGMDNPDKVLSSERDFVYVNQAEEMNLDAWEKLLTRTTGRGAIMPYTQLMGDCNPAGSKHWIKTRSKTGRLRLIHTIHQDNPTLYDDHGKLTKHGASVMNDLSSLTGVRRKRLFEGIWATAEGAVYDTFDSAVHVLERDPKEMVAWYLGLDEGYTNPAVILLVGEDSDKRHHIFKEFYKRGVLQQAIVEQAAIWTKEYQISLAAVDAAAAGLIADLRNNNIPAQPSKGRVLDRIQLVQDRLKIQGDKRPRLTIDPSCVNTINDFESRVWKPEKDEPVKENDHGTDAYEYLDNLVGGSRPYAADLIDFV